MVEAIIGRWGDIFNKNQWFIIEWQTSDKLIFSDIQDHLEDTAEVQK
ncbi:MAG: hypothetical protein ACI84R_002288 [Candidatus Azotimanducaceae bacterium]